MATILTDEQRQARAEHCRRIASLGGRATVERHGAEHMSRIGKEGFRVALELGYGEVLARKLGPSYAAKYGRSLILGAAAKEKNALRAQARRLYRGMTCDVVGCDQPAQIHHLYGVGRPDANDFIAFLCRDHHVQRHQAIRAEHRAACLAH